MQNNIKKINQHGKSYLIAEIGINHDGDINKALQLIYVAASAGFHAVKFQKRDINSLYTDTCLNAPREGYQNYKEYKEKLEFGIEEYRLISKKCKEMNIDWFASVWDIPSFYFFMHNTFECAPSFIKLPSAQTPNKELLSVLTTSPFPVLISTGMCTEEQVETAITILRKNLGGIFQCTSTYPCLNEETNLNVIKTFKSLYQHEFPIGFSNHSPGVLSVIGALFFQVNMVEVHITLDRSSKGTDHSASIEPEGIFKIAKYNNVIPLLLGDYKKQVTSSEKLSIQRLRNTLKNYKQE